ncbi:MAG: flagellar filament capping protein FliD [Lachnospiraceae bacterium]|nr:flagellar filament capping protein FliD [uncultured Acetatifactor sp.]MCI8544463.1 flagellar filament capping protein FliD [Lachnospiraceae bacterium]
MPMRLSGLMSGMDTESIIQQLVEAKKTKVTKAVKAQKSLKYKQDAWKSLNTQVLNLYNKSLNNMRFQSSFIKKTTKVSNSSVVSVITGDGAMNSVQSLKVNNLAKTGYLTGGELPSTVKVTEDGETKDVDVTGKTTLGQLGFTSGGSGSIRVKTSDGVTNIEVNENTTIDSFISALKSAGLSANFDEANGRIHIAAKSSGTKNDFSIIANNLGGAEALKNLKLSNANEQVEAEYKSIIDNEADTITARKAAKLSNLTANWNSLLAKRENILKSFSEDDLKKIADKMPAGDAAKDKLFDANGKLKEDVDFSTLTDDDWGAINSAIQSVAADATTNLGNGTLTEADKEVWQATADAMKVWTDNQQSITDVEDNFVKDANGKVQVDANGKPALTPAVLTDVENEVKAEVQAAKEALAQLKTDASNSGATKTIAEDAEIELNGVKYTSDKNTFAVNGLTLTVSATTAPGESVTITTEDDTDGIYDMIKNFFKEYNTLINQMDKLYNADSAKGYEPLTDEEKDAMSDSAIEEWEKKIKDSILRKDSVLGTFSGVLKQIMMEGVEVNGKMMYLSNFGINTLNYFSAADNERNAYHIDGDPDDSETSGNADKLKTMIANDPDTVVSFFTQLSKKMYNEMFEQMKGREGYSSAMTVYDDKKMQSDYDDYTTKIKELEKKLADYEDKWYAKFAAMETALAKMQNNASAVTSLLGG